MYFYPDLVDLVRVFCVIHYKYEGYYASVFYAYIASLGLRIVADDVTNRGRLDFTVEFRDKYYIFEFKVTDEDPLKEIKQKRDFEKYLGRGKEVITIGIVFDENIRNKGILKNLFGKRFSYKIDIS